MLARLSVLLVVTLTLVLAACGSDGIGGALTEPKPITVEEVATLVNIYSPSPSIIKQQEKLEGKTVQWYYDAVVYDPNAEVFRGDVIGDPSGDTRIVRIDLPNMTSEDVAGLDLHIDNISGIREDFLVEATLHFKNTAWGEVVLELHDVSILDVVSP